MELVTPRRQFMNEAHKVSKLRNRKSRLTKKAKGKSGLTQRQKDRLDAIVPRAEKV